ncbi:MAG: hypothetical protein UZ05_CHB002000242 [Chlorobi bacterium OLB5]|nr:MAG: hypothetical protein UZ05_CHB002000242 [Chlorobi bacterium OLB5]
MKYLEYWSKNDTNTKTVTRFTILHRMLNTVY